MDNRKTTTDNDNRTVTRKKVWKSRKDYIDLSLLGLPLKSQKKSKAELLAGQKKRHEQGKGWDSIKRYHRRRYVFALRSEKNVKTEQRLLAGKHYWKLMPLGDDESSDEDTLYLNGTANAASKASLCIKDDNQYLEVPTDDELDYHDVNQVKAFMEQVMKYTGRPVVIQRIGAVRAERWRNERRKKQADFRTDRLNKVSRSMTGKRDRWVDFGENLHEQPRKKRKMERALPNAVTLEEACPDLTCQPPNTTTMLSNLCHTSTHVNPCRVHETNIVMKPYNMWFSQTSIPASRPLMFSQPPSIPSVSASPMLLSTPLPPSLVSAPLRLPPRGLSSMPLSSSIALPILPTYKLSTVVFWSQPVIQRPQTQPFTIEFSDTLKHPF